MYKGVNKGVLGTAQGRAALLLGVLLIVGALFSTFNAPLAASAAGAVQVAHITEAVPTDPMSKTWDKAQEATIPLSSQQIYQPGGGTTRAVYVKAEEDGQNIGIRVSWDDDTKNDTTGQVPSDAAAIQLPMDPTHLPYQCMGQSSNRVNIWQWKAALEREGLSNLGAEAVENPGVRNLTSNGICRAVETPGVEPQVHSFHDGKQWHVVFYRALGPGSAGSAPIITNLNTSAAFAIWNGARGEARGMKAVSTWNTLQFQSPPQNTAGNLLTLGVIVVIAAGVVGFAMRRMSS